MNNHFELGKPLNVIWHFKRPDGGNYSLMGQSFKLFCYNSRGRFEIKTAVLDSSEGFISFILTTAMQTTIGGYTLCLELTNNSKHQNSVVYKDAFFISNNIKDTDAYQYKDSQNIELYSVGEYSLFKPLMLSAGSDGWWYLDGSVVIDDKGNKVPTNVTIDIDDDPESETFGIITLDKGRDGGRETIITGMRNTITAAIQATKSASTAADYAKEQGDYAKEQGDYAKEQGDYAKEQGDYAKEQGDYAKEQGDYVEGVKDDIKKTEELVDIITNKVSDADKAIEELTQQSDNFKTNMKELELIVKDLLKEANLYSIEVKCRPSDIFKKGTTNNIELRWVVYEGYGSNKKLIVPDKVLINDIPALQPYKVTGMTSSFEFYIQVFIKNDVIETVFPISFVNPIYYGNVPFNKGVDFILENLQELNALIQKSRGSTIEVKLENEKLVYMYPVTYGKLTSIVDNYNQEQINAFIQDVVKIHNENYYIYILDTAVSVSEYELKFY